MNEMLTQNRKLNLFSEITKHVRLYCSLVVLLLMLSGSAWAQVLIGEQSGTATDIPISGCWGYSYTQQLVYASEINTAGDITSVSFYYASGGYVNSLDWTVYVGHTSQTTFATTSDWVAYSSLQQVFSGTVSYPAPGNWMTITFATPFTYNGTDNLVIAVDENTPSYTCSATFGKTAAVTDSKRGIVYSNDNTNPDPVSPPTASARVDFINNMILGGIQQSCPAPDELVATDIALTTATLGWTENGSATSWEVVYGASGFNPGSAGTTVSVSTNPSTSLSGLSSSTSYDFYVKAICDVNDESSFSGPHVFITACDVVSTLPYTENFDTYGTGSTAFPYCWRRPVTYISGTTWPSIVSGNAISSPNSLKFQSAVGIPTYAVSPAFATDITDLRVTFMLKREGTTSGTIDVGVMSDESDINTFELVGTISPTDNLYHEYFFDLNQVSLSGSGNYIALRQNSSSSVYYYWLDNFEVDLAPSCIEPTSVTVSAITTSAANITWAPGNNETQWEVIYGAVGFDPEVTGTTISVSTNPSTTLSGLDGNTPYDIYVRAICGASDESALTGPVGFRTACGIISNLPYTENFDTYGTGSTAFPACWERPVTYISGTTWPSIVSGNAISSPNSLKLQSAVNTPTYAVSPAFAADITDLRVTFMLKREGTSSGTIDVGVMSDANDINTFELVATINPSDNLYHEYIFNLDQVSLAGSGNHIAVRHNSSSSIYYYWIDNFEVDFIPSCLEPTALTVSAIEISTVDASWTPGENETQWEVIYGEAGFNPLTEGTTVSASNDTEITLSGLTANTAYSFYVKAICNVNDESSLAGPKNFKTACGLASDMFENFDTYDTGNIVPDCWVRLVPATSAGSMSITSTTPASGTRNIYQYTGSTSNSVIVVLPEFNNIDAGTHWLRLKARVSSGAPGTLSVGYVTDAGDYSSFTSLEDLSITNTTYTAAVAEYTVVVPSSVPSGARIAIKSANDAKSYYWDDVYWEQKPSCLAPSALATTAISSTTADLTWDANNSETSWNISWGTPGYTPGDANEIDNSTTTTTSYQISGLTAETSYDVYVQADCGAGDTSDWTGPFMVFTGYCPVSTTNSGDYLSSLSSSGAVTNVAYSASSQPVGSYANETGQLFEARSAESFLIATTYVGGTNGVNVWVDWNENMQFDESELVATQLSSTASKTLTIAIPAGTPEGDYRMRVRALYNALPAACGNVSYGTTVDFTLSVLPPPSCPTPLDLIASSITSESAMLSWTENGSATQWEVVYGVAGFDPETEGTTVSATNDPEIILTGLSANTSYAYYVTAICGIGDESAVAGPASFKTACGAVPIMFEDFDAYGTGSIVPDCWVRLVPATSAGSMTISSTSPASGTRNIYQYTGSTSNSVIVVLPQFNNIDAGTHWLRLKARVSSGAPGTLSVGYVTDAGDYSSFASIEDLSITNTSYTAADAEYTVVVPSSVPAGARIAIKNANDAKTYYWDDVYWEQIPSCFPPTSFIGTLDWPTTVDLAWTAGDSETSWNISWGTPGYTPGDANEVANVSSTSTSYQIAGLTPDTNYDIYVQADCGEGNVSPWVGPVAVFTGYCIPNITSTVEPITYVNIGTIDNTTSASSSIAYEDFTGQTTQVNPGVGYPITLKGHTGGSFTNYFTVFVDWNQNGTLDDDGEMYPIGSINSSNGTDSKSAIGNIQVPIDALAGNTRMRIIKNYSSSPTNPCGLYSYGQVEDYTIAVVELEICRDAFAGTPDESALSVCDEVPFTLNVSGASEPAIGLVRVWQSSPSGEVGDWTDIAGANMPTYHVTAGVAAETYYRYVVTCEDSEEANVSDVILVELLPAIDCYCTPTTTDDETWIDGFIATGDSDQNIENISTGASLDENGYSDYTNLPALKVSTEGVVNFTVNIDGYDDWGDGATAGVRIWVDWNQDGIFGDQASGEIVYSSSTYLEIQTGTFTIPASALGTYRLRVGASYIPGSGPADPCGLYLYGGEYEDYNLEVIPAVSSAELNGSVTWNSNCGVRAATVKLYEPGTAILVSSYIVSIQSDGSFNIPELEIGTFDVIVNVNGYLAKGTRNVVIAAGANSLSVGSIINGDINGDGKVNVGDFAIFASAFPSLAGDPSYNPLADFNCDGKVNLSDFPLFVTGFNKLGDTAPLLPIMGQ